MCLYYDLLTWNKSGMCWWRSPAANQQVQAGTSLSPWGIGFWWYGRVRDVLLYWQPFQWFQADIWRYLDGMCQGLKVWMLRTHGPNSSPGRKFLIMKVLTYVSFTYMIYIFHFASKLISRKALQVAEALHDIRVLHRDMKSANVFLCLGLLNESICITPSTKKTSTAFLGS